MAFSAQSDWKDRAGTGIHADLHAYFVEVHSTDGMCMGPVMAIVRAMRNTRRTAPNASETGPAQAYQFNIGCSTAWIGRQCIRVR